MSVEDKGVDAFLLLKAVGDHRKLMKSLSDYNYVKNIYNIAGDNDILINVKSESLEELQNHLNDVRSMEGVINSTTYIVLQQYK